MRDLGFGRKREQEIHASKRLSLMSCRTGRQHWTLHVIPSASRESEISSCQFTKLPAIAPASMRLKPPLLLARQTSASGQTVKDERRLPSGCVLSVWAPRKSQRRSASFTASKPRSGQDSAAQGQRRTGHQNALQAAMAAPCNACVYGDDLLIVDGSRLSVARRGVAGRVTPLAVDDVFKVNAARWQRDAPHQAVVAAHAAQAVWALPAVERACAQHCPPCRVPVRGRHCARVVRFSWVRQRSADRVGCSVAAAVTVAPGRTASAQAPKQHWPGSPRGHSRLASRPL